MTPERVGCPSRGARHEPERRGSVRAVSIATSASNEVFIQAHREYKPGEESISGIEFHPAIYEEIIRTKNLLSTTFVGDEWERLGDGGRLTAGAAIRKGGGIVRLVAC